MLNIEYYKDELKEIIIRNIGIDSITGKPKMCDELFCLDCVFKDQDACSPKKVEQWLQSEHVEQVDWSKVVEALDEAINVLSSNGWIPCSERLPETFEPKAKAYLTTNEDGMIGVSYYHHGWSNGYESVFDVIAWQPLPEPYREEQ